MSEQKLDERVTLTFRSLQLGLVRRGILWADGIDVERYAGDGDDVLVTQRGARDAKTVVGSAPPGTIERCVEVAFPPQASDFAAQGVRVVEDARAHGPVSDQPHLHQIVVRETALEIALAVMDRRIMLLHRRAMRTLRRHLRWDLGDAHPCR